jgi:acetoin:2,6-dichlorophenolindophenol oxidoreductase subunit alpha
MTLATSELLQLASHQTIDGRRQLLGRRVEIETRDDPSQRGATIRRTDARRAFQLMLRARALDEKLAALYRAGRIPGGVYLGRGHEAISAAAGLALQPGDVYAPTIRDTAGRLAFGESMEEALQTWLGSALGPMRGRDGNIHRGRPRDGYLPMISHLGAMISVVNGSLIAKRFKNVSDAVGLVSLGDGATSTGAFHEGLNQAAVEHLPLVVLVANNRYAYSTPNSRQFACASLLDRAAGYGIAGHHVDGTDLLACLECATNAITAARSGAGPQLIVADLLRLCGHGEHDDNSYIDPELQRSPLGRDCISAAESLLMERGWLDRAEIAQARSAARDEVEIAIQRVQAEPAPSPLHETWQALATNRFQEPKLQTCSLH